MAWPPTVADVKEDQSVPPDDTRDDARIARNLAAAVAFVERVKKADFNFDGDPLSDLPAPTADIELGTMRLAYRWKIRPRSPDGLVNMGELGIGRVPTIDPDIERMLRIGRHQKARVG